MWPVSQMSAETAASINSFFGTLAILATVIAAISGVFVFVSGNVKEKYSELEKKNNERQIEVMRLKAYEAQRDAALAIENTEKTRKESLDLIGALAPRTFDQGGVIKILEKLRGHKFYVVTIQDFEARRLAGYLRFSFESAGLIFGGEEIGDQVADGIEFRFISGHAFESSARQAADVGGLQYLNKEILDAIEDVSKLLNKEGVKSRVFQIQPSMTAASIFWRPDFERNSVVVIIGSKPIDIFLERKLPDWAKKMYEHARQSEVKMQEMTEKLKRESK